MFYRIYLYTFPDSKDNSIQPMFFIKPVDWKGIGLLNEKGQRLKDLGKCLHMLLVFGFFFCKEVTSEWEATYYYVIEECIEAKNSSHDIVP